MSNTPIPINGSMGVERGWLVEARGISINDIFPFLRKLSLEYQHDDTTALNAVVSAGIAAIEATAKQIAEQGGPVIGPKHSETVTWLLVEHIGAFPRGPKRMQCVERMLYPSTAAIFKDTTLAPGEWDWLQAAAQKCLDEYAEFQKSTALNDKQMKVIEHLRLIVSGTPPFGFTIESTEEESISPVTKEAE